MTVSSGRLILPLSEPALNNSGAPVSGATMTVHVAGGSTLADLFADSTLTTDIANPQTSDSAGRFYDETTEIWADSTQAYDVTLDFGGGSTFTYENVYLLGAQTNVSGFAPINSPTFTGTPQAPTPASNDNSAKIATTAYVQSQGYAPLNSPALTGVPTAPTAAANTNTTQIATTAFVAAALAATTPTNATTGYTKFAGFIIQWTPYSLGSSPGSVQVVTWPITFPTAVIGNPFVAAGSSAGGYLPGATSVTTTGCTLTKSSIDNSARNGTVFVFGY